MATRSTWDQSFGPGQRTFSDLVPHGDAAGAISYLIESQAPITATIDALDGAALDEPRPTHLGVELPASRIIAVLLDEQIHHGAEIGLLRDLYRCRRGSRRD